MSNLSALRKTAIKYVTIWLEGKRLFQNETLLLNIYNIELSPIRLHKYERIFNIGAPSAFPQIIYSLCVSGIVIMMTKLNKSHIDWEVINKVPFVILLELMFMFRWKKVLFDVTSEIQQVP